MDEHDRVGREKRDHDPTFDKEAEEVAQRHEDRREVIAENVEDQRQEDLDNVESLAREVQREDTERADAVEGTRATRAADLEDERAARAGALEDERVTRADDLEDLLLHRLRFISALSAAAALIAVAVAFSSYVVSSRVNGNTKRVTRIACALINGERGVAAREHRLALTGPLAARRAHALNAKRIDVFIATLRADDLNCKSVPPAVVVIR